MSIRIAKKVANSIKNDPQNHGWKRYADSRQLVEAIKALRALHPGLSLKEAKDAVEIYISGGNLTGIVIYGDYDDGDDEDMEIYTVPSGEFRIIKDASGYHAEYRQTTGYFTTRHQLMQEVINWVARL